MIDTPDRIPDRIPDRRKARRTWPQRLTLITVVAGALACFVAATALAAGQWVISQRQIVSLESPSKDAGDASDPIVILPGATTALPASNETTPTIVLAEPDAANFLLTGADNGDCAGTEASTGDRADLGERSDTIMIWRANPESNQLAVLSLPRDLYVKSPGGGRTKINSQYRRDDPSRLIETIYNNFEIPIDHYIQIDFCAFKKLVNAVGGVNVPFDFPARDRHLGFLIPAAGCVRLDGEEALNYVRSRYYEYEDPAGSGDWYQDGTSDFGRISRQQDFMRRVVAEIIGEGLYKPDVASALIATNRNYIVTDDDLSVRAMLEFGNTLRSLDPADIANYVIESSSETVGGLSVQVPRVGGDNMKSILAVFRGEARLEAAPVQAFETTTTPATATSTNNDPVPANTPTSTVTTTTLITTTAPDSPPESTLPSVQANRNTTGVAPDPAAVCN